MYGNDSAAMGLAADNYDSVVRLRNPYSNPTTSSHRN